MVFKTNSSGGVCKPPVIIIGLSMGALIVQEMLLKYPKLCKFGIAMGTSGSKKWLHSRMGECRD